MEQSSLRGRFLPEIPGVSRAFLLIRASPKGGPGATPPRRVGQKKITYFGLRGLPFGHPPLLAFSLLALALAGLVDLPPFRPIAAR